MALGSSTHQDSRIVIILHALYHGPLPPLNYGPPERSDVRTHPLRTDVLLQPLNFKYLRSPWAPRTKLTPPRLLFVESDVDSTCDWECSCVGSLDRSLRPSSYKYPPKSYTDARYTLACPLSIAEVLWTIRRNIPLQIKSLQASFYWALNKLLRYPSQTVRSTITNHTSTLFPARGLTRVLIVLDPQDFIKTLLVLRPPSTVIVHHRQPSIRSCYDVEDG